MFIIKNNEGDYYKSCFRNLKTKKIIEINWVKELINAKVFNSKEEAQNVWAGGKKPKACLIKEVQMIEKDV